MIKVKVRNRLFNIVAVLIITLRLMKASVCLNFALKSTCTLQSELKGVKHECKS